MLEVKIRVKGQIGEQWSDWFEGMTITPEEPNETVFAGRVVDQSALYGLLTKTRDLGLALVSVEVTEIKSVEL